MEIQAKGFMKSHPQIQQFSPINGTKAHWAEKDNMCEELQSPIMPPVLAIPRLPIALRTTI